MNAKLGFLVSLLLMSSCATVDKQSPEKLYRKDMRLKIDGIKRAEEGTFVLPAKSRYEIKAYLYKKASIFKVRSCHREWVWFDPGDEIEFVYEPDTYLEMKEDTYCPVEIGGFDEKGQHSWAYIDVVGKENLTAELSCNGQKAVFKGVSICQSRASLIQRVSFSEPVKVYHPDFCAVPEVRDDGRTFLIELSGGKCLYLFQDGTKRRHRLTTFGYDDVIMR